LDICDSKGLRNRAFMKAFVFSDLHAQNRQLFNLSNFFKQKNDIDIIICAGDILNMGEPISFIPKFIETINEIGLPFFWVPGNNDFGRGYFKLNSAFKSLEGRIAHFDEMALTGVGGSPASWSGQYAGENMIDRKSIGGTIFVSHVPPPGLLNMQKQDCKSPTSLRKFSDSPLLHICGHQHSRWGCSYLGQTKVINPGPLSWGQYAIINLDNLEIKFERFFNNREM
jgi:Icc-related predicted phosphoesterase